jgi:hypothetical protein
MTAAGWLPAIDPQRGQEVLGELSALGLAGQVARATGGYIRN